MNSKTSPKTAGRRYTGLLSRFLILNAVLCVLVLLTSTFFSMGFFQNMLVTSIGELENEYLNVQAENMDSLLEAYSDRLYELAVDSELLSLAKRMNAGEGGAEMRGAVRSQLKRYMGEFSYVTATLALPGGELVAFSRLHDYYDWRYWFSTVPDERNVQALNALCDEAARRGGIAVGTYPSRRFGSSVRFFHLACPMYDLLTRRIYGTVVLSVNAAALQEIANPTDGAQEISHGILVTDDGVILAHSDPAFFGQHFPAEAEARAGGILPPNALVLSRETRHLGFTLYRVVDRALLLGRMKKYIGLQAAALGVMMALFFLILSLLTRRMTRSIRKLMGGIERLAIGETDVQVPVTDTHEIGQITEAFDHMSHELAVMRCREAEHAREKLAALNRQHLAEMRALERQIDAHFLYNTLNTINYTAMASDDLAVSQQIRHLALILRYTFEKSDGIVTAAQVMDWLNSYLTLQKLRFGDSFDYTWLVEESVREWPMRKLLVQPFVENAVLHGFAGRTFGCRLRIAFQRYDSWRMRVTLTDNGHGFSPEVCRELNAYFRGDLDRLTCTSGIGMTNACQRLQMYYHGRARVFFRSERETQTVVTLILPRYERGSSPEDSSLM